jgi:hypothetical protein
MPYKVLVDDLTVNSDGPAVTDLFGNVLGYQQVSKTYARGAVLEDEAVGDALRKAVDDGQTEGYLEKVGQRELDDSREAQEPFPGYNDMDVEQIQLALRYLPSDAVRAIVEFESSEAGQGRAGIVDWHIGRGEAYTDRLMGRVGSKGQEPEEEKEQLRAIVTREVQEDDFRFGESLSDDGQPQVPFGAKEGDQSTEKERETREDSEEPKTASRRGRRATKAAEGAAPASAQADSDTKDDSGS